MNSGKLITLSVWLLIIFNLLLSSGAIWSFQRMTPEIKQIYERNVKSLSACEAMLMAMTGSSIDTEQFRDSLQTAENNITEAGEAAIIRQLYSQLPLLENADNQIRSQVTRSIIALTNCNKQAIAAAAIKTQQLRQTGAWGIVIITLLFFLSAIHFEQKLRRTLLTPLQEISQGMEEYIQGNSFRRCSMYGVSADMRKLFVAVNDLLDRTKKS